MSAAATTNYLGRCNGQMLPPVSLLTNQQGSKRIEFPFLPRILRA